MPRSASATRFERAQEGADGLGVAFASGTQERYDLLVVAEGVGSPTRGLLFPGENDPRPMDMTISYFTIARTSTDDRMWRWYNAPGGRSVSLRPDAHGTTRAMLSLSKRPEGEETWDAERQKAFLRERFAGAGWETERVLAGLADTKDFYLDVLRQVRMGRWSRGGVVLTGDAAWCVTPLGGVGATLAVTGAYVLAEELARSASVAEALQAYERQMRPLVKDGQGIPKLAPRLMHPRSRLGVRALHAALGLASLGPVRKAAARAFGGSSREPDLSRYA